MEKRRGRKPVLRTYGEIAVVLGVDGIQVMEAIARAGLEPYPGSQDLYSGVQMQAIKQALKRKKKKAVEPVAQ